MAGVMCVIGCVGMSIPSNDPKEAFKEIAERRRQEMLDAAQKQAARELETERKQSEQQTAFAEQEQASKARGGEREQWRQDKHSQLLEDEESRKKKEKEMYEAAERQRKLDEEKALRDKRMAELHKQAVDKRRTEAVEGARTEEARLNRNTATLEDTTVRMVDTEAERRIDYIKRESEKKKRQYQAAADRDRQLAEDAFNKAKKAAKTKAESVLRTIRDDDARRRVTLDESNEISHAEAARKKVMLELEHRLEKELFDIDTETKRLIAEVEKEADYKESRARKEADRKRKDAAARRERVEDTFGKKEKKDSRDPMSIVKDEE